ncbi:MAG: glycoside hydrolase family 3 N-terminal domain-containing protein, partial [Oscillospiraceae bacterium]
MKQKKPIMKPKKPLVVILGLFFIALIAYGLYNYTDFFKFSTKNNDPQKTNSTPSTNSTENVDIPTPSPTPQIPPMPKEWQDNGIFNAYYEKAYEKMSQMTVEQKLSQLLWVRCPEGDIATSEIKTLQPGGLVLFKRDFEGKTAEEIQKNINAYQTASDIPLLIATDEEGGKIIRASQNKKLRETPFASPMEIFAKGGVSAEVADANAKADFLKNLGVNVVLAPVADVSTDPENYIYDRTIGQNAEVTADYVSQVVRAFNAKNIGSSLKHFPGYGTNIDTHGSLAVDTRPKETFENGDLLPFKSGISAGVPCVLVSHNIVNAYDEENPASLSANVH